MSKIRVFFGAVAIALLSAATLVAPAAGAETPAESNPVRVVSVDQARTGDIVPNASYADCPSGYVCFYTGFNGSGSMCRWSEADDDWRTAPGVCSWAATTNVRSIYNRGVSSAFTGVAYWSTTNQSGSRIGCTRQGSRGNLAGTYRLRSHEWVTGSCG